VWGDTRRTQLRVQERGEEAQLRWAGEQMGIDTRIDNSTLREMDEPSRREYLDTISENRAEAQEWLTEQDPDDAVRSTVEWLLDHAENLSTNEFAALTATEEDEPFELIMAPNQSGTYTAVGILTTDQRDTLTRVMRQRVTVREVRSPQELLYSMGLNDEPSERRIR